MPFQFRETCSILGYQLSRELLSRANVDLPAPRNAAEQLQHVRADRRARLQATTLIDAARECVRSELCESEHYVRSVSQGELVTRALSTAAFGDVLEEVGRAFLIEAFDAEPDTTLGWTATRPGVNFQEIPRYGVHAESMDFERVPRGGAAPTYALQAADVTSESFRAHRFARRIEVDEQDLIDDSLGAIQATMGRVGEAGRRVRPDLVYSLLLANPTLNSTDTQLFHADHGNVVDEALSSDSLAKATQALREQRIQGRPLGLRPKYLIVAPALEEQARKTLRERELNDDRDRLRLIVEDRIGPEGVKDPASGTTYTGSDDAWFLVAGGRRPIEVAHTRERPEPRVRAYPLARPGAWGSGWDVWTDLGAGVVEWRSIVRGNV